uniref:Uncharacterized protein n=1 Tax=viral metagenome TaxID=1070528 RepID=A0A6M3LVR8_9ZZZZ
MTSLQLLYLIADTVQFIIGVYVIVKGLSMMYRRWDRTELDYHAGAILTVLGAIIVMMLRVR